MPKPVRKAFEDFTSRNLLRHLNVQSDDEIICSGWSVTLGCAIYAQYDKHGNLISEY